jgi:zona occludens toxin (predicted ATPase)
VSFRVGTTATTTSATKNHAGTSNLKTSAATGDPSATDKAAATHKKINKLFALVTAFFISSYYVEPSLTIRNSSSP